MARPRKKQELEILSVDIELGVSGSAHTTHIKIWPRFDRALVWDETPGHPSGTVGGEISIVELLNILSKLKRERRK